MISADEVYRSIEGSVAGLRREEAALAERIQALTAEAAALRREEAETFRALAASRLDAIARAEVTAPLDRAERAALEALEARRAALERLEAERADLAERLEEAEAARARAEAALADATAEVEALAETVHASLADDPDWTAGAAALGHAEAQAAAADAKADRAEADRAEKTRAYDADPLFRYLWERGFGTGAYRAASIVKHFDGKVARLIGYARARPDYHRLHEIPRRLRAHADRLAAAAEERRAALETRERAALEAAGIVPLEEAAAARAEALEEAEAGIDRLEAARDAAGAEAARLRDPGADAGLSAALADLAGAMRTEALATLAAEARATPGPEDDRLVTRLAGLAAEAAETERRLAEAERSADDLARRRAALEDDRRRFRDKGYGAPGGGFDNETLIGELIKGIAAGALRGGLADALSTGYRRPRSRSGGGLGGGVRLPRRTGGVRRSGGGFRTGGSF